jgi:hypothetical protein
MEKTYRFINVETKQIEMISQAIPSYPISST